MPTPSMKPIRLRMERANEHGRSLSEEISAFYETNPYEIVRKFELHTKQTTIPSVDPSKGIHEYRVAVHHEVPDRVAILAGDILKDMRSALDYLAWQLALAQSDTPPQTTAFPIFRSENAYRRDRMRFIGGIDAATHAAFDAVQPYHAGDKAKEHPLWVLHRLANDDKHRVAHVVGSLPQGVVVDRPKGIDFAFTMRIGPFDEDTVVATVAVTGGAKPDTELDLLAQFAVAFGEDTPALGRHLTGEIDRIGREVDATIRSFEQFFV